jgi:Tannase-like family of unknown function (DUF6351)
MWRGNPVAADTAWSAFVAWVEAIHADDAAGSLREKTIRDKPAAAVDGCWKTSADFTPEPQTFSREAGSACNALFPSFGNPRLIAGGPLAADVLKCQLKPVEAKDYAVAITPAEMIRLRQVFPAGVCDWPKPGVGQTALVTWASFGPAPENLVFDVTRTR